MLLPQRASGTIEFGSFFHAEGSGGFPSFATALALGSHVPTDLVLGAVPLAPVVAGCIRRRTGPGGLPRRGCHAGFVDGGRGRRRRPAVLALVGTAGAVRLAHATLPHAGG